MHGESACAEADYISPREAMERLSATRRQEQATGGYGIPYAPASLRGVKHILKHGLAGGAQAHDPVSSIIALAADFNERGVTTHQRLNTTGDTGSRYAQPSRNLDKGAVWVLGNAKQDQHPLQTQVTTALPQSGESSIKSGAGHVLSTLRIVSCSLYDTEHPGAAANLMLERDDSGIRPGACGQGVVRGRTRPSQRSRSGRRPDPRRA